MIARKLTLGILCTAIAGLALADASALAATPETPTGEKASEIAPTTATVSAVLNPSGPGEAGEYRFVYSRSSTTCRGLEETVEPRRPDAGAAKEAVSTVLEGLMPGTFYTFCTVAFNPAEEGAEGAPVTFKTASAAPTMTLQTPLPEGDQGETLTAKINPSGISTTYFAEYVPETQFDATGWSEAARYPEPPDELPAGVTPVGASVRLSGLTAGTAYRYKLVAHNSLGTTELEGSFLTEPVGSASSPFDGRAYELVSTLGRFGEPYAPAAPGYGASLASAQIFQAAKDGNSLVYVGGSAETGSTGNVGFGEGSQYLATRTGHGWVPAVITPEGVTSSTNFAAFSEDLSTGYLFTGLQPPPAPETPANCFALFARSTATGSYRSLVTATQVSGDCGKPMFAGASADGKTVIFQSEAALTPGSGPVGEPPPGRFQHNGGSGIENGETCMFGCNLYESVGGELKQVNVLEGQPVPSASYGGYKEEGKSKIDLSNAISASGDRIFWTVTQEGASFGHVYVLEDGLNQVQVSGAGVAEYWTASPDGQVALYTEEGRLWRFDTTENTREPLTPEGAGVQGVVGMNSEGPDGAYIYFVATGALAENENSHGAKAQEGAPNLYLVHEGQTTFVGTLSSADNEVPANRLGAGSDEYGDWVPNVADRTSQVTPDGRNVAFSSVQPLTGYETGQPPLPLIAEAFRYSVGTGDLNCLSCDPAGAPQSVEQETNESTFPVAAESSVFARRWMSENGRRIFFETKQPLVSWDTNSTRDVYEWEEAGEGSCSSAAVSSITGGCTFLVSGGESLDQSYLVDADSTGSNVFITHRGPLGQIAVPASQYEMYDVRVGGGFPGAPAGCAGPGCSRGGSPAQSVLGAPASEGFVSTGNFSPVTTPKARGKSLVQLKQERLSKALKACHRLESKKKRAACERSARGRYGTASINKKRVSPNNKRRTK